jgi:hypothetical protein
MSSLSSFFRFLLPFSILFIPWTDSKDDFLDPSLTENTMSTKMFNLLVEECYRALLLRQSRNQSAAHPLYRSDMEAHELMLNLYNRAVKKRLPVISGFYHLASAAVKHVEKTSHNLGASSGANRNAPELPVVDLR